MKKLILLALFVFVLAFSISAPDANPANDLVVGWNHVYFGSSMDVASFFEINLRGSCNLVLDEDLECYGYCDALDRSKFFDRTRFIILETTATEVHDYWVHCYAEVFDISGMTRLVDVDQDGFYSFPAGANSVLVNHFGGHDCVDAVVGERGVPGDQINPGASELLAGCDGVDNDCDNDWDEEFDEDGDNFAYSITPANGFCGTRRVDSGVSVTPDCDDDPNACGAACNPDVTWYKDSDGDKHYTALRNCIPNTAPFSEWNSNPAGLVSGDCAAGDPLRWKQWPAVYPDLDNDGFGDMSKPVSSQCLGEPLTDSGWSEDNTDCNDDAVGGDQFNTGRSEECDTEDHDCDGNNYNLPEGSPFFGLDNCQIGCENKYAPANWADHDGLGTNFCCGDDADERPTELGTEVSCDDVDNDCDGNVDEGLESVFYRDADGDGLGDPANSASDCEASDLAPDVYVANSGDGNDDDFDNDGLVTGDDNCPSTNNGPFQGTCVLELIDCGGDGDCTQLFDYCSKNKENQDSASGDLLGDACDDDIDGDGFDDVSDFCPLLSTATNLDRDGDGVGEGCDNCIDHPNADQADTGVGDGTGVADGVGDACDNLPVINIPVQDVDEDTTFSLDLSSHISDPDLDSAVSLADHIDNNDLTILPGILIGDPSLIDSCTFNEVLLECQPKPDLHDEVTGSTISIFVRDADANQRREDFNLKVNSVNDLPTADNYAFTVSEDAPGTIPIADLPIGDVEDPTDLEVEGVDVTGTVGVVTFTADSIIYNPDGNFESLGSLASITDEFGYTIKDTEEGVSVPATILITVNGENDLPVITSTPVLSVDEDSPYFYDVDAVDVDVGDDLVFSAVNLPSNLGIDPVTGVISGTPDNGDVGTYNVEVDIQDGVGGVTQSFVLTVVNTNDAPTFVSSSLDDATEDYSYSFQVLVDDVDVGAVLTYSASGLPTTLSIDSSTGIISGTPVNADVGTHTVEIAVSDGSASSASTFSLEVINTNDVPTASDDSASTDEDNSIRFDIISNDNDVDVGDVIVLSSVVQPAKGRVDAWANEEVTFSPDHDLDYLNVGDSEDVTFTYRVKDTSDVESNDATVTVYVSGVNDAPVAMPRTFSVAENGVLNLVTYNSALPTSSIVLGDVDVDDDEAGLKIVSIDHSSIQGTFSFDLAGQTMSYVPNHVDFDRLKDGDSGTDTFTYALEDPASEQSSNTVTITVNGVTDHPVFINGVPATIEWDDPLTAVVDLSTLVSENDGDVITWSESHNAAELAGVVIDGNLLKVEPIDEVSGMFSVSLTADDGDGSPATGTFSVNVVRPESTPTWDSISIAPNLVKGGGTITVTADNVDDVYKDPVKLYCHDTVLLPDAANSLFDDPHPEFGWSYAVMDTFTAPSSSVSHTIYCRLYDVVDEIYSDVLSTTYTSDVTPVDLASVGLDIDGDGSAPYTDNSDDDQTVVQIIGENGMQCKYGSGPFDYASSGTACVTSGSGLGNVVECTVASPDWRQYSIFVNCIDHVGNNNDGNNLEVVWDAVWNTIPEVSQITTSPSDPRSSQNLNVNYDWYDLDGDSDNSLITWTNGFDVISGTDKTLSYTNTLKGEVWSVSITAGDGETSGNTISASFPAIRNTAPNPTSASLAVSGGRVGDTFTCSGTAEDIFDPGDNPVAEEFFQFLSDGSEVQVFSSNNQYVCAYPGCKRDKQVTCQYKSGDGEDVSTLARTSAAFIVLNSPPTVSGATVSYAGERLTCTGSGSFDADGNYLDHFFRFFSNGVPVSTRYSNTEESLIKDCSELSPGACDSGKSVTCEYNVGDRNDAGTATEDFSNTVTSGAITIP